MNNALGSVKTIKKLLSEVESNIDYLLRWNSDPGKVKTEGALFSTQAALQHVRELEQQVAKLESLLEMATRHAHTEKPAFGFEVIVWEPSTLPVKGNPDLYHFVNNRRSKRA